MGMFDYVNYESICPVCKNKVDGFQTKDGECILDLVEPQDVDNFYTHCDTCGVWIEFLREDKLNFQRIIEGRGNDRIVEHDKLVIIK